MKIKDLLEILDRIAPFALAESWDNVGLQIGSRGDNVGKILVALEVTADVIEEAERQGASVIVAHHPLIFSSLKSIDATRPVDRLVCRLIRSRIALIASHTNLDSTADGTNGEMADRLGLINRRFLRPLPDPASQVKYTVFVPTSHVDAVIDAVHGAGAGVIGEYSHCTFRSPGTGTYKPLEGANPYAGSVGKLEHASDEVRLETVCPRHRLDALVAAVRDAHPYEEAAFDVYPLVETGAPKYGLGLIGELESTMTLNELREKCAEVFSAPHPGVVGGGDKKIATVAVCSGSGGEVVKSLHRGKADVLVTGEMNHHACAEAEAKGLGAILVGHFESEVIVAPRLTRLLEEEAAKLDVRLEASAATSERPPVRRG